MAKPPGADISPARRLCGRILVSLAWVAIIPMVLAVAIKWLRLDTTNNTVVLVTFLPWLLLPAYGVLGVGVGARKWRLVAVSLLVVGSHAAWVLDDLAYFTAEPRAAADAPQFRVLASNLFFSNPNVNDLYDELMAEEADVLVLSEMNFTWFTQLGDHEIANRYPHRWYPRGSETMVLSTLPFLDQGQVTAYRVMPWVEIEVDGTTVRVMGVHANPATDSERWTADLGAVDEWVEQQQTPVVLMGDFNATAQHRQFNAIVENGLVDAHLEQGSGWGATWPTNETFGPVLRLDHILHSDQLTTADFRLGVGTGSDHLPVIADLIIVNP